MGQFNELSVRQNSDIGRKVSFAHCLAIISMETSSWFDRWRSEKEEDSAFLHRPGIIEHHGDDTNGFRTFWTATRNLRLENPSICLRPNNGLRGWIIVHFSAVSPTMHEAWKSYVGKYFSSKDLGLRCMSGIFQITFLALRSLLLSLRQLCRWSSLARRSSSRVSNDK